MKEENKKKKKKNLCVSVCGKERVKDKKIRLRVREGENIKGEREDRSIAHGLLVVPSS